VGVVNNCQSNREAWLAERRTGIGGSDAAAVAGLSPWKTGFEVYLEKIGELTTDETDDMRRGTLLEPAVRQMYADETGRSVVKPTAMIRNTKLPFALGNLDGIASGNIIFEGKTSRTRQGWGEPGTAEIPFAYLCQVQHYMAVAELGRADVAVLFGDFEFAIYPVDADAEFQTLLMEQEAEFWKCVERRIPPEPISHDDIKRRWPRHVTASVVATVDDLAVARVLNVVRDRIRTLEEIKDQAEAILKASIKDAEGLHVGNQTLCTWKSVKTNPRFDAERFRSEHPDLYQQYLHDAAPSRRFTLKEKCPCLEQTTPIMPPIPENLLPALKTLG